MDAEMQATRLPGRHFQLFPGAAPTREAAPVAAKYAGIRDAV